MKNRPGNKKGFIPEKAKPFQFKPGVSGNPSGRPKNPIPKALRDMSEKGVQEIISAVCSGNLDQLQEIIESPKTPALQVGYAKALVRAIKEGNVEIIERLLERVIGKVPDYLNLTSKNLNLNVPVAQVSVSKEEIRAEMKRLMEDV